MLSDCWKGREIFYVTTTPVVQDTLQESGDVHVVGECNRQHPIRLFRVLIRCVKVVFSERPDVVISTGAAPSCMLCFFAKILGAKIVWIDSITNVEWISLSGRMVRYIADLFLVQWSELAARYRNVEYVGSVI